jgi:hypothetical protein
MITYENWYYLVKDINTAADIAEIGYTSILFETDSEQTYTSYNGGVAVAGNTWVSFFNAAGKESLSVNVKYGNPRIIASDKYFMTYDFGSKEFSIYNSFSEIFSGNTEYEIRGAAISNTGSFAIITSSKEYTSAVYFYNSSFKLKNGYYKDKYVTDVDINAAGELIAVVSVDSDGESFSTELMICRIGEDKAIATINVEKALPLNVEFRSDGGINLICNNGIYSFNDRGKAISSYLFGDSTIITADSNEFGSVAVLSSPDSVIEYVNKIVLFDRKGKLLYNDVIEEDIISVHLIDDYIFMLTSDSVIRLNYKTDEIQIKKANTYNASLVVCSKQNVMLCSDSIANHISFN